MVGQQQKQERRFVVSLKKKKTLLLSQVMVRFLLVLILGISIMSCSPLHQKVECVFSNQSEEGFVKVKLKLLSNYLMCQITSVTNQDRTLPIDTLTKD